MANLGNETHNITTTTWLTPPAVIKALGEFDLDPCASLDRPWDTA
ncbi:MAG: adenine methyltransferase, partial [Alphaproteobacteria bacterium]|nr:adenine methyltransferase [Alphaproteobacteria bacterium]